MKNLRKQRGITLIALVITIIVLLILAGVSIAMLTGNNGILTQANNANVQQSHAAVKEAVRLAYNEWRLEVETSNNTKIASTETVTIQGKEEKAEAEPASTFLDYLVSKNYIDEETGILNVENLTGSKQSLGNGTGTDDVYKLEEENGEYKVVYYENGTTNTVIDTISNTVADTGDNWDETATDPKYFTFIFNEEDKTAILTGVKDEYAVKGYYQGETNRPYTIAIIDGDETITDVVIPMHATDESGVEYTVTEIGSNAFWARDVYQTDGKSMFTSFKIPETVTNIGSRCFGKCVAMKSITLPTGITSIEPSTFENCTLLEEIKIPEKVTSIGYGAFENCTSLKNVTIDGKINKIGNFAFVNCTQLKEINVPGNIESMGSYVFQDWGIDQTINFEMTSKPETGWNEYWNGRSAAKVNWGVEM